MHISYKPLWHTLLERDMRKEDLRLAAAANRQENDPDITAEPAPPLTEVLDGDRESLPE